MPSRPQATAPRPISRPAACRCGKIGKVSLSRLVLGGNLIGGWAHSRDLMYASKLFTSYNTEAKIFETLDLALACGVNTIQLDPACWGPMPSTTQREREDPDHGLRPLHDDKTA